MVTPAVNIVINGKNEKIGEGISVRGLLELKGININLVACELNLKIIRRAELSKYNLKEGDHLEIIQMMGGG